MTNRLKSFLTFALFCVLPLLVLNWLSFRSATQNIDAILRSNLNDEVDELAHHYVLFIKERERELTVIANGPLPEYLRNARTPEEVALIDSSQSQVGPASFASAYAAREAIINLPGYYANIACFDSSRLPLFLIQPKGEAKPKFRTKDFLPGLIAPDESIWRQKPGSTPQCSIISAPSFGYLRRCNLPVFSSAMEQGSLQGVLVADLRVADLFDEGPGGSLANSTSGNRRVIVLDAEGKLVYHDNAAFRNQFVKNAMPDFAPVAADIVSSRNSGIREYVSVDGEQWLVGFRAVDAPGLWVSVARNYTAATQAARQAGWRGAAWSLLLGMALAFLLNFLYQRKMQSLQRVTESVTAIAHGQLDQELLVRSNDDMRLIADGVNLVTERLREQLAREAEASQFESFTKLSALLTHDLKNAIEGLSLLVGNMERHFDNPEFRADAMQGLTTATDKLRQIVSRLSNPVNTLSGEFKLPRPTDLIPLLERVMAQIVDPVRGLYEVEIKLPPALPALADGERIEKIMENLLLNAIEAIGDRPGKLTIEGGPAGVGKVFFSISDTGAGMSPEFVREKLFRPFSTTKVRGVGLGLYTCREVVRAHQGAIEVDSKPGYGTTFRVVLASPAKSG